MRRFALLLGLLPVLPLAVVGACASPPPGAHVGLVMKTPEGLLQDANEVSLAVFDVGSSTCGDDGAVKGAPSAAQQQEFTLTNKACPSGDTWCTTIQLDRDGTTKMFQVLAKNGSGLIAQGCGTAAIDQDPLDVTIQVKRFIEAGCCNDGTVQVGEECDTGVVAQTTCSGAPGGACKGIPADPVCDCGCFAQEILLSIDDASAPSLKNGAPGTKAGLAMAFTPGSPALDRALRAVFVNTGTDARGGADIEERFLQSDLYPFTTSPAPLAFALSVPVECQFVTDVEHNGFVNHQQAPRIAAVGNTSAIVFMSDENQAGNFDIFLVPQSEDGCTNMPPCQHDGDCVTGSCVVGQCAAAEQISVTGTVPGAKDPDIAEGPASTALVVWSSGSEVLGRIWSSTGALTPSTEAFVIAENASAPRVAGNVDGWRVVWQGSGQGDADGIFMASVDPTGEVGAPVLVNELTQGLQDQPVVAMLEAGNFAVAWHSQTDVYFQRFDATGAPSPKQDQNTPLNTITKGDQQHPAIAASIGAGSFFAVAWETIDDASIHARFLGGKGGFGYNTIDGQNGEFVASHPAYPDGQRHNPAVTIGGGGYVVLGWEDVSPTHNGIFVRRFPLPTL